MSHNARSPQLEAMAEADIDEACLLVSEAMNENEGRWARATMLHHFGCRRHGLDDGRSYFVWRRDGAIRGLVGLHHYVWGPEENVWLSWLAVHPDHQRQGIGSKLMADIEGKAAERGYTKLFVETYDHPDFDVARAFYAAVGFDEAGRVRRYLPDGSDMVVYGKELKGPSR